MADDFVMNGMPIPVSSKVPHDFVAKRAEYIFTELKGFIDRISRRKSVHCLMLEVDELRSQAYEVIVTVCRKTSYADKPMDELIKITKTSIRNRIATLRQQQFYTRRKHELYTVSLTEPMYEDEDSQAFESTISGFTGLLQSAHMNTLVTDPLSQIMNSEKSLSLVANIRHTSDIRERDLDLAVLGCLIGRNIRVHYYLELTRMRKNYVHRNGTVRISPLIIARALCRTEAEVKESMQRIGSYITSIIT